LKGSRAITVIYKVTIVKFLILRTVGQIKIIRSKISLLAILFLYSFPMVCWSQQDPKIQFIENKNQWPGEIDYGVRVSGGNMFIGPHGFSYYFLDQKRLEELHDQSHANYKESSLEPDEENINGQLIRVNFLGSNPAKELNPFRPLSTYYNYFIGSDPKQWASKALAYEGVQYSCFYEAIDLKLYSSGDFIKYDFVLAPEADYSQIKFQYSGAEELTVMNGDMHAKAAHVSITEKKPEAFQIINGERILVACEYVLSGDVVTFAFPEGYDTCYELIIDPLLIFSTYSGSQADNWGSSATPGEHGSLYSTGVTIHYQPFDRFPATPGAFQTTYGGVFDVALLKYDSLGQHLLYASYLGGDQSESPHSLVMNNNKELLVLGTTSSTNFPTTPGAISQTFSGGTAEDNVVDYANGSDIFIAKISSDGSSLLSSTYLGGTSNDGLNPSSGILTANYGDQLRGDILTDSQGNIFVSTVTSSADFPVANSFGMTYHGGATDALILKLNPNLTQITWGAFLGGTGTDASHTIQLDKSNNIFVAGGTNSTDFPTTAGVYQTTNAGAADGWISRIANDGSAVLSSTLTGGSGFNQIYFLDLNSNDEVYVYGQTQGNFPVSAGVYHNTNGGQFLQKFSSDLTTLHFSTVFGSGRGMPDISPTAFLVNECDNIYMSGWGGRINTFEGFWPGSSTFGMPLTDNAFQKTTSGSDFYFIVLTADASQFLYGTYLGGTQSRTHVDGGTSRFDKSGIVYHAVCSGCQSNNAAGPRPTSDFPTTPGVWSRTNNSINCNNAAFKFDLSSLQARIQTNSVSLKLPGLNKICFPDKIVFQNRSIGGKSYEWKFGDTKSLIKTDTSAITYQYAAPGQYVVKLKAFDPQTCLGTDSTSAIVTVNKPQGTAVGDFAICQDATTQITASGGGTYVWKDADGKFNSTLASPQVAPTVTTTYYVTITDVNGCIKKDTVVLKVVPKVNVDLEVERIFDCVTRPMVRVVNKSDEKADTFIDFGDGATSDQKQDQHFYDKDGYYTVRVVGKKEFCVYDKKVELPFFTLFAPNVFTPGGSPGFNDTFRLKYGEAYISDSGIKVSLVVYDRWGVKVYENKEYKDNWTGDNLAAGTYFYEAEIAGQTKCKNWVQIIR
jgi:CHU_C Type IX secretion signal domain/PKD domain